MTEKGWLQPILERAQTDVRELPTWLNTTTTSTPTQTKTEAPAQSPGQAVVSTTTSGEAK